MTEPRTIQVVAMVADNSILTFYKTDGSVYTVTQGDPRGLAMTDEFVAQRSLGTEVITLTVGEDLQRIGHLSPDKRKTGIRFFTVALDAVKKLFGKQSHEDGFTEESHEAAAARVRAVAARIMADGENAQASAELPIRVVTSEQPMEKHETIIAVTDDGIVPHVENLTDQFKAAEEGKAPAHGTDNLIVRLAKISSKRGHTAMELLAFIKKIDLPILDDGSFFAYKRLLHRGDGLYVDPHTQKVFQRIGDVVEMDESLVDKNRRQECSQGIHVGTRHYMGNFHQNAQGSGTCLVLIQPEDVIAVPQYEASKMRVCRYTLVGDLSNKAHTLVGQNKAMDDCIETMDLLAGLLAGARPAPLGTVRIGGPGGTNLTYHINGGEVPTNTKREDAQSISNGVATAPTKPITPVRTIKEETNGNRAGLEPVKVRTKTAVVTPAALKTKAAQPPSRQAVAGDLVKKMRDQHRPIGDRKVAASQLTDLKKKSKVSWTALGLTDAIVGEIKTLHDLPLTNQAPAKPAPAPAPAKTAPQPKPAVKVEAKPEPKAEPAKAPTGTRQDRARALWEIISTSKDTAHRKQAAEELRAFKKSAKVGWDALGLGKYNVEAELKKLLD